MFEKEAEDRAFEKYPIPTNWDSINLARNTKYEEGFKDGAEFGYKKANEWHYVKEEKNKAFKECLERISEKFGRVDFRERLMLRMAFDAGADLADVIAWKEIVLPKESE